MKILLLMAAINSLMFMACPHPVIIMILIITQAIIICTLSWLLILHSWFSFIMFLIFLGGLMVLFIYITSLASNEKIMLTIPQFPLFMIISTITITVVLLNLNEQNILWSNKENLSPISTIMNLYSLGPSFTILFTMLYLLLTLIITIKISNKFEAPIKSLNLNNF